MHGCIFLNFADTLVAYTILSLAHLRCTNSAPGLVHLATRRIPSLFNYKQSDSFNCVFYVTAYTTNTNEHTQVSSALITFRFLGVFWRKACFHNRIKYSSATFRRMWEMPASPFIEWTVLAFLGFEPMTLVLLLMPCSSVWAAWTPSCSSNGPPVAQT